MIDPDPFCVLDASVAIDLIHGDIVLEFDALRLNVGVPDVILAEVVEEKELIGLSFETIEYTGEQMLEAARLKRNTNHISVPDLFALISAREGADILLTGDADLRQLAETEGMKVHGILWVLDELVQEKVLVPLRAAQALKDILNAGSFLPEGECERRFRRWGAPPGYWDSLG